MAKTSGTVNGGKPGLTNRSDKTVCISQLDWVRSETDTTITYTLGVYIYCVQYGYSTSGVLSTSLACSGQTTRKTSGGSCSLSAGGRVKLSGNWTYTFAKTTSSYSQTISFSLTSTGSSVSGTSSGSLAVSIPALTSHKVSYNSNGGGGTINQQTKYYRTNIVLSDGSNFTRTNHTLTGWNTAADGSGTAYALGATYTVNSTTNITLYAQWHMDYIKPTITKAKAYRVQTATSSTPYDNGTYIYVSFSYTGGKQPTDSSYTPPNYIISINGTSKANGTLQASGSWPTTTKAFGSYSTSTSHTITIKLYDGTDAEGTTVTLTVGIPTFPIDLITNGNNTYMGVMTAAQDGTLLSVPSVHVINPQDTPATAHLTDDAFIIGNRTSSNLHNAMAIRFDGEISSGRAGRVLWSGEYFMTDTQTAIFTNGQKVSDQLSGIVLVWSAYDSGKAQDYNFDYQFIPKWHVLNHSGTGVDFIMMVNAATNVTLCKKYVYVYDNKIVGNANNTKTGTGFANNTKVLRAVIGV